MFRLLLAAALIWVGFAAPAAAQDPFLEKAERWFNSLDDARADFIQIGPDGSEATGTFYLNRPGRMRFEYDAPLRDFIVADGVMVHFYDGELDDTSNALIGQTPAEFILRNNLDFTGTSDKLIVTETRHSDDVFRMTLVQRNDPEAGKIFLDFAKDPIYLIGWGILDAMGGYTKITLTSLDTDVNLDPSLFRFVDPAIAEGRRFQFNQ